MKITKTEISDLIILEPQIFKDQRGEFLETFSLKKLEGHLSESHFIQDNQSTSKKNVFRGLHFQNPPHAQAKLVRVTKGRAMDYVVDLRAGSKTFKKLFQIELSAENHKLLFVPKGFAHGFHALEENTIFQYKCSAYYEPSAESGILYTSVPELTLETKNPILNSKDLALPDLSSFITPF